VSGGVIVVPRWAEKDEGGRVTLEPRNDGANFGGAVETNVFSEEERKRAAHSAGTVA
jgi:hypothetical protein